MTDRKIIMLILIILQYSLSAVSADVNSDKTVRAAADAGGNSRELKSRPEAETVETIEEEAPDESEAPEPVSILGMHPADIFETLGPPDEIYPLRGENNWQDDVVFYYNNNLYLFIFKNRVWQIRADYRYQDKILGIKPGLTQEETIEILGRPFSAKEGEYIFLNPASLTRLETGFPLRMRILYDTEKRISDIYLYRGDY